MEEEIIETTEETFNYNKLRYILNKDGYICHASLGGLIVCDLGECTEYNGDVPDTYETIEEWYDEELERLNAWKIVDGNLVFDETKYNELQAQYEIDNENNSCASKKYVNDKLNQSNTIFDDNLSVKTNELYITNSNESEIPEIIIEGKGDLKTNTNGYIEDSRALPVEKFIVEGKSEQKTNILPSEYTQVDYLQSNGKQYIDIGVKPSTVISTKTIFSVNDVNAERNYIYGTFSGTGINRYQISYTSSFILIGYGSLHERNTTTTVDNNKHYLEEKNGQLTIDNVNVSSLSSTFDDEALNIYLFACNGNGTISNYSNGTKIYLFEVYNSGTLIRKLVPCYRNSDNVAGMYDVVNNVFYTNNGTGAFTYGSVVTLPSPDYPSEIETVKGIENLFNGEFEMGGYSLDNGSKLGGTDRIKCKNHIKVTPNTTYTFSFANAGSIYVLEYDENKTYLNQYTQLIYRNFSGTITLKANTKYITFYYIPYNHDLTLEEPCQIEKGTIAHPFVPYGSRYLINKITGKQLFNKNNVMSGYFNSSGSIVSSGSWYYQYIKVQPNENYVISGVATNNPTPQVVEFDKDMNFVRRVMSYRVGKFITNENTAYVGVSVINTDLSTYQFEKNSIATEFEPYKENIITYDLKKENLFDKNTITLDYRLGSDGLSYANKDYFLSDFISVDSLSTYTYKRLANNISEAICYYDENKNFISRTTNLRLDTYIFKTTETTKYIRIADSIDSLDIAKVYEGSGTDDYYELVSIGDIKDKLDETTGELTKKMRKLVLDGTNNKFVGKHPTIQTDTNGFYQFYLPNKIKGKNGDIDKAICTHLKYIPNPSAQNSVYTTGLWWEGTLTSNYASIPFLTISEANQWLIDEYNKGTPVTVYYVLAEPETIQLEPTEIELFEGVNNINVESNIEPSASITYTSQKTTFSDDLRLFISNDNILPIETVNHEINGLDVAIEEDRTITLYGTTTEETEIVLNGAIDNIVPIFMLSKDNNFIASGLNEKITLNLYSNNGTDRELVYSGTGGNIELDEDKYITCSTLTIASGIELDLTISPMVTTKEIDYTRNKKNELLEIPITELKQNEYLKIDRSYVYLCDGEYDEELKMISALKSFKPNTLIQYNHDRLDLTTKYFTEDYLNERISKIEVEQGKINLEVSQKANATDLDGKLDSEKFTGANILLEVNKDESNATINADKINLNGVVTANNTFKINTDGSMEATGGKIGGWTIGTDRMFNAISDENTVLFANGSNEYKDVLVIYTGDTVPFYLHSDGYLHASNANISGTITSSSGTIGGFTLGTYSLSGSTSRGSMRIQRGSSASVDLPANGGRLMLGSTNTNGVALTTASTLVISDNYDHVTTGDDNSSIGIRSLNGNIRIASNYGIKLEAPTIKVGNYTGLTGQVSVIGQSSSGQYEYYLAFYRGFLVGTSRSSFNSSTFPWLM